MVNSNRKRQSSHWSQSAQSPTEPSYSPLQQEMFHYCTLSIGTTAVVCMDVCVCVHVCVCVCGHVYVVYEDTNLYNDMGMT